MRGVFGLETEYGITVRGANNVDVVAESIALVRSYTEHGAHLKWNYHGEDPHQDARGFRAKELLQDTDEAAYFEIDHRRALSFEEIKSDLVLSNGARFYNDHAHPEYATPECTSVRELVAQDRAGEHILAECARRRNAHLPPGQEILLYKNNTDFSGHSYGCHDNYLIARATPWGQIVAGAIPFLITRQIFAGAGKLGIESESEAGTAGIFQLSQRADFFSELVSIDTMNRRPLINTRDEPHADKSKYRRFHVIIGDSNMSEWATALKIGTTALVLGLIERKAAPKMEIADPIAAVKTVSRDLQNVIALRTGKTISALEIQRAYLAAAEREFGQENDETRWILGEWRAVLDDLERDPARCRDRIDWVAKKFLLESFREEERLEWEDPWLQAIDLEYHRIDSGAGLFYELEQQGAMRQILNAAERAAAEAFPPTTTRAYFRGRVVARFQKEIASIQWDEVAFGHDRTKVDFPEPVNDHRLDRLNALVREAGSIEDFFRALKAEESAIYE